MSNNSSHPIGPLWLVLIAACSQLPNGTDVSRSPGGSDGDTSAVVGGSPGGGAQGGQGGARDGGVAGGVAGAGGGAGIGPQGGTGGMGSGMGGVTGVGGCNCPSGCNSDGITCRECKFDDVVECVSTTTTRKCTQGKWAPTTNCPNNHVCSANKGCICPAGRGLLDGQCFDLMGYHVPFNYLGSISGGFLQAFKITVTRSGTLRGLGLHGQGSGTRVRMALYKDASGSTSSLLAESIAAPVLSGANHYRVVSSVFLAAGTYWVGAVHDGNSALAQDLDNPVTWASFAHSFTKAFPSSLGSASSATSPLNYFILLE